MERNKTTTLTVEGLFKAGFTAPQAALDALTAIGRALGKEKDLANIRECALDAPSPDEAIINLAALIEAEGLELAPALTTPPDVLSALMFLLGASPFLSRILLSGKKLPQRLFLENELHVSKTREVFLLEIQAALKAEDGERTKEPSQVKKILRLYKEGEFLRIGARDLLGLAVMQETTLELSHLAEAMLEVAIEVSSEELTERFGRLTPTDKSHAGTHGFAVIGLGKLGGKELNYSSDIDIMYVYDEVGSAGSSCSITPAEFYTKLGLKVSRLLDEVTAEGLVFRVDLDLRPGGKSGALAHSITAAELYYEAQGRQWERAAMIKARCVAGDRAAGRSFLKMIRPFVYRRNLDFRAIEEIKTMKESIDLAAKKQGLREAATNVKLGRGGIREIEFFTQALQLIHGGRVPELTLRATLPTLKVLLSKGLIRIEDEDCLREAYVFLRNLEHRLQIIECRQTHTLRHGSETEDRVARMMGFKETEAFTAELKRITESVHEVFRGLFYSSSPVDEVDGNVISLFNPETDDTEQRGLLQAMGFKDPAAALGNLELLRKGPPGLRRTSARGRAVFERAAPFLLSKVLAAPNPDMALKHLEKFISRAGASSARYALLVENPHIAEKLINIFGSSEFLSEGITERPENLDLLLSQELSTPCKTEEGFLKAFEDEHSLFADKGLEGALDAMRRVRNNEVLRIGLNHLAGTITPTEVSEQMTLLAEAALHRALLVARSELKKRYPVPKGARFAVIGLGKLGARELGYGSDLDIIFIYTPGEQRENIENSISEHEFFVKLCQRIISALTVKTREGAVFEVDTRLRPSGSAGPLVIASPAFIKYHSTSTALWERQAFIRARYVAGDKVLGREAVREVQELLYRNPLKRADIEEMLAIRKRMEVEIGKESATRYNFKTGRGALVDIEFLTQALQLHFGGRDKKLRTPGTMEALEALVRGGYMEEADYEFLKRAYGFFRGIEFAQRIKHNRAETFLSKDPEKVSALARTLGCGAHGAENKESEGGRLLEKYSAITSGVRKIYENTLKGLL